MSANIPDQVRSRALHRCEYCLIPQVLFRRSFHVEHIIARQHGGKTELDNLALACWQCNLKKGPNLTGIDPDSGMISALFHPRRDVWNEHFVYGVAIKGLTSIGRATVAPQHE